MTPMRARRPCARPGCGALAERGSYCDAHRPAAQQRRRDPEQQRFYGSTQWKQLRALVKAQQPVCALCNTRPTEVVDHYPNADWRDNRRENLRGLCRQCEGSRTGRQHVAKRGDREGSPSQPPPSAPWYVV